MIAWIIGQINEKHPSQALATNSKISVLTFNFFNG
jgi:hypothetical protein